MKKIPLWQYDEYQQCGVDYSNPAQVQVYDQQHLQFRDYEKDTQSIIRLIDLKPDQTVIDMGCGTGAFVLHAANHCRKIYAVDVSRPMLETCRQKVEKVGLSNIEFHQGGFLTYQHYAEPADALVSVVVLHHLPDFWKLIGLQRAAAMLKPGGKLYLFDAVFSFDVADYQSSLDNWVHNSPHNVAPGFEKEMEIHVRAEYSTLDRIMEYLLQKAGFNIDKADYHDEFTVTYICTKDNKGK